MTYTEHTSRSRHSRMARPSRLGGPGRAARAACLPVGLDAGALNLVAEVLAEIHGDPMRLLDREPLVRAQ